MQPTKFEFVINLKTAKALGRGGTGGTCAGRHLHLSGSTGVGPLRRATRTVPIVSNAAIAALCPLRSVCFKAVSEGRDVPSLSCSCAGSWVARNPPMGGPRNQVVQFRRFGDPDGLEVVDAPLPTAGRCEVRVRVLASAPGC